MGTGSLSFTAISLLDPHGTETPVSGRQELASDPIARVPPLLPTAPREGQKGPRGMATPMCPATCNSCPGKLQVVQVPRAPEQLCLLQPLLHLLALA